jgi:hypothetical protein
VLFLTLALVLAALWGLHSADTLDSGDEIPNGRPELLLERSRDTTCVDRRDGFLLQLPRNGQSPALIAAGERLRDLVTSGRQCRRNRRRKLRLRGDSMLGAAPATSETERSR